MNLHRFIRGLELSSNAEATLPCGAGCVEDGRAGASTSSLSISSYVFHFISIIACMYLYIIWLRILEDWKTGPELLFIADLGDIIDQQCETMKDSERALRLVLDAWREAPSTVYHLVGNHELYNFNREEAKMFIPNIFPWYRSFIPVKGWRFLILDAYEMNVIEKGGGPDVEEAIAYFSQHNPNDVRAPRGSIDMNAGLSGLQRRFVPMGGGIKAQQLEWFRKELRDAKAAGEKAVAPGHSSEALTA